MFKSIKYCQIGNATNSLLEITNLINTTDSIYSSILKFIINQRMNIEYFFVVISLESKK